MAKQKISRLRFNPPLGRLPVLQFIAPAELQVDHEYQRSLEAKASQRLISRLAQHWNWDLCQPLVVSRRQGGDLFVIDGQHRWEAAKLRGDIAQLPCVVVEYESAADEAASFVHLNQQRRPLSKIDLFKAAIASEDKQACAILEAIEYAELSVAPHQNYISWKPGMVSNIGGIEASWRDYGPEVTGKALQALAQGFAGQVLRYAGTIFPGIAAVCADEMAMGKFSSAAFERLISVLQSKRQKEWRSVVMQVKADNPDISYAKASAQAIRAEWSASGLPGPASTLDFVPERDGKAWCDQCDELVTEGRARGCTDKFCSLRKAA